MEQEAAVAATEVTGLKRDDAGIAEEEEEEEELEARGVLMPNRREFGEALLPAAAAKARA